MKRTPEQILKKLRVIAKTGAPGTVEVEVTPEVLKEIDEYYAQALEDNFQKGRRVEIEARTVLSDDELRDIIVKHTSEMLDNPGECEIYPTTKFYNNLIKALQGRVPRGLSVEEMAEIIWDTIQVSLQKDISVSDKGADEIEEILCEQSIDEKIAQSIYDAQKGKG